MNQVWLFTFGSVLLVSLTSLVGVFTLSLKPQHLKKIILYLVSFAVGALFGDTFIHLLPEAYENLGHGMMTSLNVLLGILLFFILEKVIRWRHCHVVGDDARHTHPVVAMNLVGDAVHNFIDGMIIGVSYAVSIPIGVTTTLAVFLHEIPQEIGDFGVLLHGGMSVRRALLANFISALFALLGAAVALTFGASVENFAVALLPITAGGFIYIAGSDLIPELHHEVKARTSMMQFVMIVLG
ncbi:MAG: ZIP family metal transporter, partial [Candidatus Omnitrophica bacterium]|nr:ZIP family metal transporter [Candidatus Omnitrophota bacterium]